jgi:hypothetical protein
MAVQAFTNASVLLGDLDISPFTNSVTSTVTVEMLDSTVCGTGGFRSFAPGMRNGEMAAEGFADYGVGGTFEKISTGDGGTSMLMSVAPIAPAATLTAGDPVAFMRGPVDAITVGPDGEAGQLARYTTHIANDSVFAMGVVLHPLALRSTTASGTVVAFTGPTLSQTLWAGLHVTTGSGGTFTCRVQTDDNVGFASPTTRITFTATTGPVAAGEMKFLVPVNISTETHMRADWTITAGSFTFAANAGIVPNV